MSVIVVGSQKRKIYAIETNTGFLLWEYMLPHSISSVAQGQNIVYVSSYVDGYIDGNQTLHLYALSIRDGTLLWHTMLGDIGGPGSLVLDRDHLFISASVGRGIIYALDRNIGTVLWETPYPDQLQSWKQDRLITTAYSIVYTHSYFQGIEALHVQDGHLLWSSTEVFDTEHTVASQGMLYLLNHAYHDSFPEPCITVLDAVQGVVVNKHMLPQGIRVFAIAEQGIAYGVQEKKQQICAYHINSSTQLWSSSKEHMVSTTASPFLSPTVISDTICYLRLLLDDTYRILLEVTALDFRTGTLRWRWNTQYIQPPVINAFTVIRSDDNLYLLTKQGLYALREKDGVLLWHILTETDISFIRSSIIES